MSVRITSVAELSAVLERQRRAFLAHQPVDAATRIDRLKRVAELARKHQSRLVAAVQEDFGSRPAVQSRMEIMSVAEAAKFARKRVAGWMRPDAVSVPWPMRLVGGRAHVAKQPLGVAGIVGPWNFPYQPTLAPLIASFAAGCRAMIKPSDMTPASGEALADAIADFFNAEEVAVALGGIEMARAFSSLPFDHLLFTGSPAVAHHILHAAAENLVPVTLELGGKCPVIIDRSANLKTAAERILSGKGQNGGQICLAPDTVFVPDEALESFIEHARATVSRQYPTIRNNPDYTAVINQRNYDRLTGYIDEARAAETRIETLNPAGESFEQQEFRKIPPTLVIDPDEALAISREEIFGPILAVRRYRATTDVVDYINARPRPLALYFFGRDKGAAAMFEGMTTSGGMTVNDVIMHAGVEELPFGGIGNSGMGAYHGRWGFDTFTHRKAVYRQGRFSLMALFTPPYRARHMKMLERQFPAPAGVE